MPIFARIRLYEYMETGADAGTNLDGETRDVEVVGTTAHGTPDINDPTTWIVHQYNHAETPVEGETTPIHNSIKWQMGGSTVYMPTFNMDKDSLKADINGTFEGPDGLTPDEEGDAGDKYDDYVSYTPGATEVGTEIYDADEDPLDNNGTMEVPDQTHTAKATLSAKVMSMAEWQGLGSPVGNFWVYDTDGWAYWASAIQPSTATGLLLNGLNFVGATSGDWYYAIYVEAQLATAFDWGDEDTGDGFYKDSFTEDGKTVLENAANVVVGADGKQYINCGNNTYKEILPDEPYLSDLICAGMDTTIGNEDDRTDITVLEPADETYGSLFLGPNSNDCYQAVGPDGLLGTADDVLVVGSEGGLDGEITAAQYVVTITVDDEDAGESITLIPGAKQQLGAKITVNGHLVDDQTVVWSIASDNSKTGSKIGSDGLLSLSNYKQEIVVQATYKYNSAASNTLTVSVPKYGYGDIDSVSPGSTTTVSIDGYDWYVLVKDDVNSDSNDDALILSKEPLFSMNGGSPNGSWLGSGMRAGMIAWLEEQETLKAHCIPVTLYSLTKSMNKWDETEDEIFVLTEADMFGTTGGAPTEDTRNYTYVSDGKGQVLVSNPEMRKVEKFEYILRNFYQPLYGAQVQIDGELRTYFPSSFDWGSVYVRPALWVTIPKSAH